MYIALGLILLSTYSLCTNTTTINFKKLQRDLVTKRLNTDGLSKNKLLESRNFKNHTPNLFERNTYSRLKKIFRFVLGTEDIYNLKKHQSGRGAAILSQVTIEDLKVLEDLKCKLIIPMLPYLKDRRNQIDGTACENIFSHLLRNTKYSVEFFKHIPEFYFRNNPEEALRELEGRTKDGNLHHLESRQLSHLLKNPENCGYIKAFSLPKLDASSAALITDRCFAQITDGISKVGMEKSMSKFSPSILRLATQEDLSSSIFKGATRDQIASFGAGVSPSEARCHYFKIQSVSESALSTITSACFLSWLSAHKSVHLEERYRHLPDNIFENINESNISILDNIAPGDWEHMKPKQFISLMARDGACAALPADAQIKNVADLEPTMECFGKMPPNIQVTVLTSARRLPDNILGLVNASMVDNWNYDSHKSSKSGLDVLNSIKSKENIGKIVSNLSSSIESGEHACSSIKNFEYLNRNEVLKQHFGRSCVDSFSFTIGPEETKKLPRLLYMRPLSDLKTMLSDSDWKSMSSSTLSGIIKDGGKFCEELDHHTFKLIDKSALSAIDAKCLEHLKFKSKLTKEEIQSFGADAFRKLNKDSMKDINIDNLTDEQFGQVGEDLKDLKEHPLSVLTEANLASYSNERLSKFTTKAWKAVPVSALKGIKAICHIPPNVFAEWDQKQVGALNDNAIISMTKEQAERLGGASIKPDAVENPVKAIKASQLAKMKDEVKSVLEKKGAGAASLLKYTGIALTFVFILPLLIL